ncbi:hypothetical protein AMD00_20805 [Viridibacillus arvi]|uniref:Uncharacterized protein n=1 Tax=Viridibacillus arvi TaxID=263475 RepID=A0A0M0LBJ7_9BACL|nr:hypothetical protein AMD00_20805 [Viridibacillus arvi]
MKREDNKPHVFIIVFFFYSRLQKNHRKLIDIYKIAHAIEGIFLLLSQIIGTFHFQGICFTCYKILK